MTSLGECGLTWGEEYNVPAAQQGRSHGCALHFLYLAKGTTYEATNNIIPLQDSTIGVLVAEDGNVLGRQAGLWSTEAKV
jgi:hypothetical protein